MNREQSTWFLEAPLQRAVGSQTSGRNQLVRSDLECKIGLIPFHPCKGEANDMNDEMWPALQ